jgi:hypothetical protein
MELTLNLIAMATILSLLLVWRGLWIRQPGRGHRNVRHESLAICCVAVLAFFAISMSDDLRNDLMIVDECSLSRSQAAGVSASHSAHHQSAKIHPIDMSIFGHANICVPQYMTSGIVPTEYSSAVFLSSNVLSDRAPPVSVERLGV